MTTTNNPLHFNTENPAADGAGSAFDAVIGAFSALARRANQGAIDPREAYLAKAVDHEDLEQRVRAWAQHEQRQRQLPPAL